VRVYALYESERAVLVNTAPNEYAEAVRRTVRKLYEEKHRMPYNWDWVAAHFHPRTEKDFAVVGLLEENFLKLLQEKPAPGFTLVIEEMGEYRYCVMGPPNGEYCMNRKWAVLLRGSRMYVLPNDSPVSAYALLLSALPSSVHVLLGSASVEPDSRFFARIEERAERFARRLETSAEKLSRLARTGLAGVRV